MSVPSRPAEGLGRPSPAVLDGGVSFPDPEGRFRRRLGAITLVGGRQPYRTKGRLGFDVHPNFFICGGGFCFTGLRHEKHTSRFLWKRGSSTRSRYDRPGGPRPGPLLDSPSKNVLQPGPLVPTSSE